MSTQVQYARITKEASLNVRATTPVFRDLLALDVVSSPDFGRKEQRDVSDRIGVTDIIKEGKGNDVTLNLEARVDELGELFYMTHQKVTSADLGGVPAAKKHDFDPQDDPTATFVSYGIDYGLEKTKEYRPSGLVGASYRLVQNNAGSVLATFNLIGANLVDAAIAAFSPSLSTLKVLTAMIKTGTKIGATELEPLSTTFEYRSGLGLHRPNTSRTPTAVILGLFDAKITFTLRAKDVAALINDGLDEDTTPAVLVLWEGDVISGANKQSIKIDMAKTHILPPGITSRGSDANKTVDLTLAVIKPASGNRCRVTLQNEIATY